MQQQRFLALLLLIFFWSASNLHAQKSRPNVLFIFVDDLRPALGCYGNKEIKTPNIDALASTGMLFNNQYVAVPTCGASRCSILTGMYPSKISDISNSALEMSVSGKPAGQYPETFIEQFKRNGYYTVGIGKISHAADGYLYGYDEPRSNKLELPNSWNEMLFDAGKWGTGWNAFFGYQNGSNRNGENGNVKPFEAGDCDDEGYPDGLTSKLATEKIEQLARNNQPFFLAVGFFKPHLPFNAPKKYWDLYNEADLSLSPSAAIPVNINNASLHNSREINSYKLTDEYPSLANRVSAQYARKLRHAYYASVSYTDAQVGKVVKALKANGLDKNTIIVLWGDHGWHLGDNLVWGKHTLFDWALRSAFIMKTPKMKKGAACENIVSSTDIYPTLMDLCGLEKPPMLDGESLVTLLGKKSREKRKEVAFSYFSRGISIRTPRYRFTKYFRNDEPTIELYDHKNDPYEQKNVATENTKTVKSIMTVWKTEIDKAQKMYVNP